MIEGQMETSLPTTDSPDTGGHSGLSYGEQLAIGVFTVIGVLLAVAIVIYKWFPKKQRAAFRLFCRKPCEKCNSSDLESAQSDTDRETNTDTERDALVEESETTFTTTGSQSQMESTNQHMPSTSQTVMSNQELPQESRDGDPQDMDTSNDTSDGPITDSKNATSTQKEMYDIFLVSSSENSNHVKTLKNIIERNRWRYTSLSLRKLGELPTHDAAVAVESSSHILVPFTSTDDYNYLCQMIVEMSFVAKKRIIPIRCCEENDLSLTLRALSHSSIDDKNLEERLKFTIGQPIKERNEVLSSTDSAASDGTNSGEAEASASAGYRWPDKPERGPGYKLGVKK